MVMKRSAGGESAGGGPSTPEVVPFQWVEIRDAEHVDQVVLRDRCSWKYRWVWSNHLTFDLRDVYFFGYACNGRVWEQFWFLRLYLIGGLRGSIATSPLVSIVWQEY